MEVAPANGPFLWQAAGSVLAYAGAGAMACLAARRHGKTGFRILAAALFLDGLLSLLTIVFFLWLLPSSGNGFRLFNLVQLPLRIISLILLLAGWAMLAFDWKPSFAFPAEKSKENHSLSGRAWKVTAVLGSLCSLPAAAWAFIILLANGMKTVPQMSGGEALMGCLPALLLLSGMGTLLIFKEKNGLSLPYLIALGLGTLLCTGAVSLLIVGYLTQP